MLSLQTIHELNHVDLQNGFVITGVTADKTIEEDFKLSKVFKPV
jgi:hypothetical protein